MAEKKTAKPGKAVSKNNEKDALAKELRSLIPKLDTEGLQFLIEQAKVHLYNMQVDALNRRVADEAQTEESAKGKSTGNVKTDKSEKKAVDEMRLEGSESGSSFYLVFQGQWLMFSRDEIAQMVRIISAPVTERDRLLFNWLERERRDVFAAIQPTDESDGRLKKIAALLRKKFILKK